MVNDVFAARLASRSAVRVSGENWRGFLQGLLTQDVETLQPGDLRYGALLTPQGRLLFELFLWGEAEGCLIECDADRREAFMARLAIYRLRAKVDLATSDVEIWALWGPTEARPPWRRDPRLPTLGFRGYDANRSGARIVDESAYEIFRIGLGVAGGADLASEDIYPLEANLDLLAGVDFHKGCFVGQETTSRMKRRGQLKSRIAPISFEGAPPAVGEELLAGDLRAGRTLGGTEGAALALLRLDRLAAGSLRLGDGRSWCPRLPEWLKA